MTALSLSQADLEVKPLSLSQRLLFSSANAGNGMFNAFFNSALPLFLGHYQLPYVLVGLLAQERSFLGSFLEPVVGALSDRTRSRWGRRRPFFLIGAPLAAFFLIVVAHLPPVFVLVPVLSLLPFFLGIANVPYRAMMADITKPEQRGRLGGTMALLEMGGNVSLLLLLTVVWATNPTLAFYVIAAALLLGFGLTFLSVKEPGPLPPAPPLRMASPPAYVKRVLAYRQASKYVVSQFAFWLGIGGVSPFVTRYGVSVLGLEESQTFQLLLVLVACTALCVLPAGLAGDLLGKQRVLVVGLLVFAVATLVGSQVSTLQQLLMALALAGLGNGVTSALSFPFLTELLPRQRMGELTALSSMIWSVAQPLGSVVAGGLADQTGTLRTAFLWAALMLVVSLLVLLTVKPDEASRSVA